MMSHGGSSMCKVMSCVRKEVKRVRIVTPMRGKDESPPLDQPKRSLSGGDYVVIVEEVKSTVQAR